MYPHEHAPLLSPLLFQGKKATRKASAFEAYSATARKAGAAKTAAGISAFGGNVLMHVLDYNSVESTLLASAVLTNLAGIMFGSSQFVNRASDPSANAQYVSLAWATFMLIVLTIVFYATAFILDALSVLNPGAIHSLLDVTDRCSSKAARAVRERMQRAAAGGKGARAGAQRVAGGGSGGADGDDADSSMPSLQNNPYMLARASGGGSGGGGGGGAIGGNLMAGGLAGLDVAASREAVLALPAKPDPLQWEAVRTGYATALGALDSLQKELREAKVRLAVADSGGGSGGVPGADGLAPRRVVTARREFAPQTAGDDAGAGGSGAAFVNRKRNGSGGSSGSGLAQYAGVSLRGRSLSGAAAAASGGGIELSSRAAVAGRSGSGASAGGGAAAVARPASSLARGRGTSAASARGRGISGASLQAPQVQDPAGSSDPDATTVFVNPVGSDAL